MEQTDFSIRKIDQLGRIVLPQSLRKKLDINQADDLYIGCSGREIIIKKVKDTCVFCGKAEELEKFEDKFVCRNCKEKLFEKKKV